MRLEIGKSYLWLFLTFMGVFVVLAFAPFGQPLSASVCLLPLFMGFLLYSQVRSKVALDSWWHATHPAGSRIYTALIVWNTLGVVGMSGMALFFVMNGF
ncbi:hypothetical protein [Bythopirellula goksoeyrii]|uniref:Uncharacterized protein n=1 Tax=Bythopirellula goksoeyrii TaxID=1400387 RepID=A0A5B9QGM8_9BACT|nr:hypothetical protein [Bythopirellula goksoeyrii]QEG37069.1 hypothetical protein Pr1d_44090 [Bythopirellula goksoeyrii]